MHEVYLKRRSQRLAALKKVVKQLYQLEEAEKFFDSLEAWHDLMEGVPDDLSDLATWAIDEEEGNLDAAIARLVTADKRVRDAFNALGSPTCADPAGAPPGIGGGFATRKTRWPLVFYDAPLTARMTARIEKFLEYRSKPAPSRNHAELGKETDRVVQLREWRLRRKRSDTNKRPKR